MRIEVHVYHHFDSSNDSKLDLILEGLKRMSTELDNLTTAVTNERTVVDSAVTLLNGLSAQIAALKNDPVALQALADNLTQQSSDLAAAVSANTPA